MTENGIPADSASLQKDGLQKSGRVWRGVAAAAAAAASKLEASRVRQLAADGVKTMTHRLASEALGGLEASYKQGFGSRMTENQGPI